MTSFRYKQGIVLHAFAILALLSFLPSSTIASANNYPGEDWPVSTPEAQGMQSHMLVEMLAHIKDRSFHIDSILIVRNGHVVLDAYFWPFKKGEKHIIHSCTKSVMSALIGIAIDKGYIQNVEQPITDFFPAETLAHMDARKQSITLENLLTMTSGLKCRDSYLYRWKGLLELRASTDWGQYVLDLPMIEQPGERFEYCNGVSYLLSVIIQDTTQMRTLAFARQYLFEPLGIHDVGWDTSPQGVDIGWGEMRLKPHDMARFGWLYLNLGRWADKQIVPSAWVEASTRGHIDATLFDRYGYQWWVDATGYYAAVGFKGQRIFVVPEKNMVVVFTGDLTGKESLMANKLLNAFIIPAALSSQALPPSAGDQVRLNTLVNKVAKAPADGFIWLSEAEGIAQDGVFTRTASPAFSFNYPFGSRKSGLDYPGQVMRMKTLSDYDFTAFVGDIPEGIALEDFGPKTYAQALEKFGTRIRVTSNKEVTLQCGTRAYRTDIKWMANDFWPITTLVVSAYKDGKVVCVSAHPWHSPYNAVPIVKSLKFH
ncbi:MAG: serine hydrolase [Desulfobacterales bacterium]|jgi:CubicO group peptidase (beta-lactamase class C family)